MIEQSIKNKILQLKKEKDVVILAHYYVDGAVQKNPTKKFYSVGHRQFCPNMKKVTLEKVLDKLKNLDRDIDINESLRTRAMKPLKRMLEIAGE